MIAPTIHNPRISTLNTTHSTKPIRNPMIAALEKSIRVSLMAYAVLLLVGVSVAAVAEAL
jgi:hypothetical protein